MGGISPGQRLGRTAPDLCHGHPPPSTPVLFQDLQLWAAPLQEPGRAKQPVGLEAFSCLCPTTGCWEQSHC